jgi:uncharacterized protein YndB with AHSA1/START domain
MIKWVLSGIGTLLLAAALVAVAGALLPRGHVAARSAVFRRPPAEVFGVIGAFAAYPEWRGDVKKIELLPAFAGKERFREHNSFGAITFEVEERAESERLVTRIADTDLGFGGTWTYELTPADGGTRLTITERGEVSNVIFRFLSRFVFSQHATIDKYLQALGRKFGEPVTPVTP